MTKLCHNISRMHLEIIQRKIYFFFSYSFLKCCQYSCCVSTIILINIRVGPPQGPSACCGHLHCSGEKAVHIWKVLCNTSICLFTYPILLEASYSLFLKILHIIQWQLFLVASLQRTCMSLMLPNDLKTSCCPISIYFTLGAQSSLSAL